MEPVYLFNLIDQQKSWLSMRQSLVAQNIANADTPGYKAQDLMPFSRVMERSALDMAGADPLHMRPSPTETLAAAMRPTEGWETSHSGNSVSPELEMIKAGEVRGAFTLDTNLMRAFHGMWMSAVRT
ncbi:flagellar basal body protein [Methylocystis parvus]|uniref:flagellar basal body protein n=1 Tax=Methylocystis parvus TaxID=134 RepID=UPI003C70F9CC